MQYHDTHIDVSVVISMFISMVINMVINMVISMVISVVILMFISKVKTWDWTFGVVYVGLDIWERKKHAKRAATAAGGVTHPIESPLEQALFQETVRKFPNRVCL